MGLFGRFRAARDDAATRKAPDAAWDGIISGLGKIVGATAERIDDSVCVRVPAGNDCVEVYNFLSQKLGASIGSVRLNPDADGNGGIIIDASGVDALHRGGLDSLQRKVADINDAIVSAANAEQTSALHRGAKAIGQGLSLRYLEPLKDVVPVGSEQKWVLALGTDENKQRTVPSARLHMGNTGGDQRSVETIAHTLEQAGIRAFPAEKPSGHLVTIDLRQPLTRPALGRVHDKFASCARNAGRILETFTLLNRLHGVEQLGGWQVNVSSPHQNPAGHAQNMEPVATFALDAGNRQTADFLGQLLGVAKIQVQAEGQKLLVSRELRHVADLLGNNKADRVRRAGIAHASIQVGLLEQVARVHQLPLQSSDSDPTSGVVMRGQHWVCDRIGLHTRPTDIGAAEAAMQGTDIPHTINDGRISILHGTLNGANLPISLVTQQPIVQALPQSRAIDRTQLGTAGARLGHGAHL